jgi:hypothetical protein
MCEKYKISIKDENKNLEIEGSDKEWVEGNAIQFLDRINNRNSEPMSLNNYVRAGVSYLLVSILLFTSWILINLGLLNASQDLKNFIWCIAWSTLGICACLLNIRSRSTRGPFHFVFYYFFVLAVTVTISFSLMNYYWPCKQIYSHSISAFVALIVGFLSYKLHDLASEFLTRR